MARAAAVAHPNIALVKYWGKRPGRGNVPATPSLSITLDALTTHTVVESASADLVQIDETRGDPKVERYIAGLRRRFDLPPTRVASRSNFPAAAGLASSASGFAALITAIDGAYGLGLDARERACLAREGSASAARSVFGGIVSLDPERGAEQVLDASEWPLAVVVAVTSQAAKAVPSSAGMLSSARTSPFYPAWRQSTRVDFEQARQAVLARDFDALANVAAHSAMKLHGLMLATRPPLLYWLGATVEALRVVQALRASGTAVVATVDAGPQVKAVCLPDAAPVVADALRQVAGVLRVMHVGLGDGARLVDAGLPELDRPAAGG